MPDEFGGVEVEETETDEFGGVIFNPPTNQKWEKPIPLGSRLIEKYYRPTVQGLGSAAGIIFGGARRSGKIKLNGKTQVRLGAS